jgi:Fe(3+) dicitrate transport protein
MHPRNFIFFILLCLTHTTVIFSQDNLKVSGKVVDSNNAALAGATVVLSRKDVRFEREMVTDTSGEFVFTNLAAGNYQLTVAAKSFGSINQNVELKTDSQIDLTLQPERVAEQVSITSSYLAGTPESLSEIPGSIERITPQQLENARVFNFSEALRKFAGVNVRDEEGFGLRPNIGIRGTNPTRSTKVLLLEDGLPLSYAPYGDNSSYYHPPVERYESIEVLKGSGQIAYGPQTLAGVINYITPNPPEDQQITFKAEGGSRSFFNGSAGYGNTFGKLGIIANFNHKQGDGSRENTNFKLYDFSSKATYALNDRNALTAKFTFFREDSNIAYTGATEAEFAANPRGNIFKNDFFYGRRFGFSLQHALVITSKVNLTTNFYSNYFSRDWWRQSSNSNERPNRVGINGCRGIQDLNTVCGNRGNLRDYLTVGIFNLGAVRNELNVGFRVHREDQDRVAKFGDLPNSRDGNPIERNERKALAYSAFIQHRFIWRDFAFTPGVRVEKIDYERSNFLFNNGAGATGKTEVTEVIPGFGVAYSGIKNTTFFAGVHRGFAPPRVEDLLTDAGGVVDLESELSWNWEVGVRTRPFRGVELSSAFFRNDYENQIVAASLASGTTVTSGGATLQQGLEFNGQVDFGTILRSPHNFYFRTAYSYLPIAEFRGERYSSFTSQTQIPLFCAASRIVPIRSGNNSLTNRCLITGNRLPYTPKNLLTSSLGYSHPIGIDAFIENVFIGKQFGDDLNVAAIPLPVSANNGQLGTIQAQTYWNATGNYKVEKWKTTFFVTAKNIFDRTFIVDRSRGILPSQPRLLQAGIKLNF